MALHNVRFKDSLGTQLLTVVFSLYFTVTMTVTLIHMVLEYRSAKEEIQNNLLLMQKIMQRGLAQSLWDVNSDQINDLFKGILETPYIVGVEIIDSNLLPYQMGTTIDQKGQVKVSGVVATAERISWFDGKLFWHEFPLNFEIERKIQIIGTVKFYTSTGLVLQKVQYGFMLILFNAFVKTFALWLIFLICAKRLLSKPLTTFALAAEQLDLDHVESTRIDVPTKGHNEIKVLQDSFNRALDKIHKQHQLTTLQNKQLRSLNKLKEEFIANVSHELRTPLMGIQGFAQLLVMRAAEDEEQQLEYMQNIYVNSQRILRIVNNMLNLSMLEAEGKSVVIAPVTFGQLAKSLNYQWQGVLRDRLTFDFPPHLNDFSSDIKLLEIALNELIHNAMVFNAHEPQIQVQGRVEGQYFLLSVSDNGIGISPEHLPNLFEKFYRVDSSIQYKIKGGVGLGLAVVLGIAQLLQGRIIVESQPGQGSRFILEFPYNKITTFLKN